MTHTIAQGGVKQVLLWDDNLNSTASCPPAIHLPSSACMLGQRNASLAQYMDHKVKVCIVGQAVASCLIRESGLTPLQTNFRCRGSIHL